LLISNTGRNDDVVASDATAAVATGGGGAEMMMMLLIAVANAVAVLRRRNVGCPRAGSIVTRLSTPFSPFPPPRLRSPAASVDAR